MLSCRYPVVYLFKYQNMRNDKFKEFREELMDTSRSTSIVRFQEAYLKPQTKHLSYVCNMIFCNAHGNVMSVGQSGCMLFFSHMQNAADLKQTCRFCMGSNKVLQVALGRQESDEYKQNISELSNRIRGKIGLFFTKLPQSEVHHPHRIPILFASLS